MESTPQSFQAGKCFESPGRGPSRTERCLLALASCLPFCLCCSCFSEKASPQLEGKYYPYFPYPLEFKSQGLVGPLPTPTPRPQQPVSSPERGSLESPFVFSHPPFTAPLTVSPPPPGTLNRSPYLAQTAHCTPFPINRFIAVPVQTESLLVAAWAPACNTGPTSWHRNAAQLLPRDTPWAGPH